MVNRAWCCFLVYFTVFHRESNAQDTKYRGHIECIQELDAGIELEIDGTRKQFVPSWEVPILAQTTEFCGIQRIYQHDCGSLVAQEVQTKLMNVNALSSYLSCRGYDKMEGHTSLFPVSEQILRTLVSSSSIKNAMQIGFNAGHSAMTMLMSNPTIHLTSFDIVEHPYVFNAVTFLDLIFPGRHHLVPGDSRVSIPRMNRSTPFDFIFIDGGHSYEAAIADLRNCEHLAQAGSLVVMDDVVAVSKSEWTNGPTRAWNEAISTGMVIELGRVENIRHNRVPVWVSGRDSLDESQGIDGIAYGFYAGHTQSLSRAFMSP